MKRSVNGIVNIASLVPGLSAHSSQPVAGQSLEGWIDPSLLVGDKHQADHSTGHFSVRHITEVTSCAISLGGELCIEIPSKRRQKNMVRTMIATQTNV